MFGKNKWLILLASLLLMLPCAAASFPDYPVRPAGDYPISAVTAGLTIAAHPLDAMKEQKTYFRTKLTSKGYLPVFIVMQNASTADSFLVKKDAITYRLLGAAASGVSTPEARSKAGETIVVAEVIANVADIARTAAAVAGGANVILLPVPDPLDLVGRILISNATEVQQNLLKKKLQSKTLSPGTSAHGFLYVPVPKGSARQKIHVSIPVTRLGSDDTLGFDLVF